MERTFNEKDLTDLPVSFRVFGYGESFQDLIQEIREIGYERLKADVIKDGETIEPTDEDKMSIILCSAVCEGLEDLLKTFYQAGVLTILVSTDSSGIPVNAYDSLMVVDRSEMISVVKTLLNSIFHQGRINYDFNDLASTLRDSEHFRTLEVTGSGKERMKHAVASLSDMLHIDESVENLSLIIRSNERIIEHPLCMQDISFIAAYVGQLPESVNVIWAINNDEELDGDTVALSVIASGKKL